MKNILNGSTSEVNVEMQNNLNFSVPSGRAWKQPLMSEHLPSQTQIKLISVHFRNSPQLVFFSGGSSSLHVFPCCRAPCWCPRAAGSRERWEAGPRHMWGGQSSAVATVPWQGQVAPAQPCCSGPSREGEEQGN